MRQTAMTLTYWPMSASLLAPLAWSERAATARSTDLLGFETEMREFLDHVLRAYGIHGVEDLSPRKIADFLRIRHGGTNAATRVLGLFPRIREALPGAVGGKPPDVRERTPSYRWPRATTSPASSMRWSSAHGLRIAEMAMAMRSTGALNSRICTPHHGAAARAGGGQSAAGA